MENVLYAANTCRIYDLKGSERSRWSQEDPSQAGAVLMDDNLRENNLTQPILYTWDKQLETWVKSSVMLGGARKEPTVISPKQYCRRFRVAISSYFVSVPSSDQALPCLDPDALM
ncbi:hypothetical protein MMC14_008367 [Varicellaria rhodocarpa]|nr:hypothetical protein [Varicellaria rhodocarpa]